MKKYIRAFLSLLLVVVLLVALAAPVLALSSTATTVESGGAYQYINGLSYRYLCRTSGSTTTASGSMTYEKAWIMTCTLQLTVNFQGVPQNKSVQNGSSGTNVSVSTNNVLNIGGSNVSGIITQVDSVFNLGNHLIIYDTVS